MIVDSFHQFKIYRNVNFQQTLTLLINFIFTSSYVLGPSTGMRQQQGKGKPEVWARTYLNAQCRQKPIPHYPHS